MKQGSQRFHARRLRRAGTFTAVAAVLLLAGMACATSSETRAVAPLPGFTMPPEWTPTPQFSGTFVEGWTKLTGNGVELMLPPSYEGGDPAALQAELLDALDEVPSTAAIADAIRQSPTGYRLLAMDRSNDSILAVTARDVPTEVTMPEYGAAIATAIVEQVPGVTILQQGVVPFRDGEAVWLLTEFVLEEEASWQLTYGVRHGDQVWNFNYGGARDDYPQLQPIFDQSLQTVSFLD
jgi:serine/threonine-protein kinase